MTEISIETKFQRSELPGSEVDNEMIFFNQGTGKYYGTGPVGAEIWGILAEPKSIREICDILIKQFEVDRQTCESQVKAYMSDLLDGGIVTTSV